MRKLTKHQQKIYNMLKNAPEPRVNEKGIITNYWHETYKNLDGTIHTHGINNKTLLALENAGLIKIIESQKCSVDIERIQLI